MQVGWQAPEEGWIKMNVDASTVSEGMVGFEVVFRNNRGEILASVAGNSRGQWIAVACEAKAILFGLQLVGDLSFPRVVMASDCLSMIQWLQSGVFSRNEIGFILQDCMHIAVNIEGCCWHHARRDNNKVDHVLARIEVISEASIWIKKVPSAAQHIVIFEIIST